MGRTLLSASLLVLFVHVIKGSDPVSNPLEAWPECEGEVRLSFENRPSHFKASVSESGQSTAFQEPDFRVGVWYRLAPSDQASSSSDGMQYKEFPGSALDARTQSLLIRDLVPGALHHIRVRFGQRLPNNETLWEEYSETLKTVSGAAKDGQGPVGVGSPSQTFCQFRRRGSGITRPKMSRRVHAATFTTGKSRPRRYTYTYYYTYYTYGSSTTSIAVGISVSVVLCIVLVVFLIYYLRGICGRPPLRQRVNTWRAGGTAAMARGTSATAGGAAAMVTAAPVGDYKPHTAYPVAAPVQ